MKISIIIPVYNVEKYIKKCIESCIDQNVDKSEYEIIVVNDGTKDNSMSVIDTVDWQDVNHTILNQSNQGLSMARNNGLKLAKGEYVWFVDSDDRIEDNCLNDIFKQLDLKLDMLVLPFCYTFDDTELNRNGNLPFCEEVISGKEYIMRYGMNPVPAQFAIYNRKFLLNNHLVFYPGIYHEDCEFKPRSLFLADSIKVYNIVVYNYYQRGNGAITSSFNIKRGKDLIIVAKSLIRFIHKENPKYKVRIKFNRFIGMCVNSILCGIGTLNKTEHELIIGELKREKEIYFKMLRSCDIKYILEGLILLCNVSLASKFYSLLKRA